MDRTTVRSILPKQRRLRRLALPAALGPLLGGCGGETAASRPPSTQAAAEPTSCPGQITLSPDAPGVTPFEYDYGDLESYVGKTVYLVETRDAKKPDPATDEPGRAGNAFGEAVVLCRVRRGEQKDPLAPPPDLVVKRREVK